MSLYVYQILSYSGGKEYKLGDPGLMTRLKFVGDPSQGNATIVISSLYVSDTATYQCKVKKPPGIDSRKITLVILGKDWDMPISQWSGILPSFCFFQFCHSSL